MKYTTRVWNPFKKEAYYSAWRDKHLVGVIQEFCRDLRRCHERIWKGYCDYDIFAIDDWFLGIMPVMLEDFKDHLHGCPKMPDSISRRVFLTEEEKFNSDMDAWKNVLDRMIFLLKEADEETCSRKNPYEEEYEKAWEEFMEKYGDWGEKLMTDQERQDADSGKGHRLYFPDSVEEYKPISDKYFEQCRLISQYRQECKDEALMLFSEWFYALWD